MHCESGFPNDENGEVLRRMMAGGDDLTQSRLVDFYFIFKERSLALAFAKVVGEENVETSISYYQSKEMWQVLVKHDMVPSHHGITAFESILTAKAEVFGGVADGWGCFRMPGK